MNRGHVLDLILEETIEYANELYGPFDRELEDYLFEINTRREVSLPNSLPQKEKELIAVLQKNFGNNVSLISFVLHQKFPEKYFFYRVSKLEQEIFEGIRFFADYLSEFELPFESIGKGKDAFDRYLTFNTFLNDFANVHWEDASSRVELQNRISYFLYQGLGRLFSGDDPTPKHWIMATAEAYWKNLDETSDKGEEVFWSGRKEMRVGDLVFLYRTTPRKAVTDIFQILEWPLFNPTAPWDGFWVSMNRLSQIPDISFPRMKNDEILGQWGVVKKNFVGTVADPVPSVFYNRLLEFLPRDLRSELELEPDEVTSSPSSGRYSSEDDFETNYLEPLFRRWHWSFEKQYPCVVYAGRQKHSCRVDFVVRNQSGPFAIFESKLKITNDRDLQSAELQARSYAMHLGFNAFVVAAPEGFWIYALENNNHRMVEHVLLDKIGENGEDIKRLIESRT